LVWLIIYLKFAEISLLKTWINANNNGVLGPFINGSYRIPTKETLVFDVKNPFSGLFRFKAN
jgi:hypothetical protein